MGSMNDLVRLAKFHLGEEHQTVFGASVNINETPMSYLKYICPKDEFQRLYLPAKKQPRNIPKNNNVIHINDIRAMKTK